MRSASRYIPRKYRTILLRVIASVACVACLYYILREKQSTVGEGKSDESIFHFDYSETDHEIDEVGYFDPGHEQAIPPAQHKDVIEKDGNFTGEALLKPDNVEYFKEEELKPIFPKPEANPSAPGEFGKAVRITDNSPEVKDKIKEGWDKHAFNHYVCEKISLHRHIGDKRDRECKERKWRKPLPKASVIIIFHNEAWCALLRTLYSVLESSPAVGLEEVILVDDASTFTELQGKLDEHVKDLKIVKVVHLEKREGLIRARLAGAEIAKGEVLVFLDSHCECAPHWLEPLLERIAEDPTRVVCPVIEVIDSDTFAMSMTSSRSVQRGILGWNLNFNWGPQKNVPGVVKHPDDAIESPTMAGGLFAMDKKYFNYLGTYDPDMKVWGGENIEMSIRIWTCGGKLEIHPCSHVGHVFRKRAPYSHPGGTSVITRNNKRVAEVWMDEYKEQYYKRVPKARMLDAGDLEGRISLRKRLKCKSFKWYLTNIYPDLYAPAAEDIVKGGEWHNEDREGKYCLDSANPDGKVGVNANMYVCHGMGVNQNFELTRQGELRHNYVKELCMSVNGVHLVSRDCVYPNGKVPADQKWEYTNDSHIKHIHTDNCIEAVQMNVMMQPCSDHLSQKNVPLGAFGWGLEFHWATQPGNRGMEIQTHARDEAFTSPVMAGACYAAEKEYFFQMGAYDYDMTGIGSENLELSFRIWMCGGSVEIHPCSRVGHIGRKRKPYEYSEKDKHIVENKMRVAEIWMDDYKWLFYKRTPLARTLDLPDVGEMLDLKDQLGCGNFEWYISNVFPDLYHVPNKDIIMQGEVRCSTDEKYCLDSNNIHGNPGSVVDLSKCHGLGKGQYYEITDQGEIRQNTISELCLAATGSQVWTARCRYPWHDVPDAQKWLILPDGHIYHPATGMCLNGNPRKLSVSLLKCVGKGTLQLWSIGQKDGFAEDIVYFDSNDTMVEES